VTFLTAVMFSAVLCHCA